MVDDSLTSVNVFSHYMKVKIFLHIFIMCYFYDLEKPETFAFPKGIVGDIGRELFKSHKTGPVPEKKGSTGSQSRPNMWGATSQFLIFVSFRSSASSSQT